MATVDVAGELVVRCDVIAMTNEECHRVRQLDSVQCDFGLEQAVSEVLAYTAMTTGANLQALNERGVTLYSPSKQAAQLTNPAWRADLSQPVPADQRDQLPMKTTKHKYGSKSNQLTKDAFV